MDHPIPTVRQRAVPPVLGRSARYLMLLLGLVCTAVGIAGLILPLLPGTVFLLIAAWAFSRSSERLHLWLFHHPRFGRTIRDWHYYRASRQGPSCWPSP